MANEKSDESEFQVVKVPDEAMNSVVEYVKGLGKSLHPLLSGSNCHFTSHGDIHCNDRDPT
jgi:hypothetical protein